MTEIVVNATPSPPPENVPDFFIGPGDSNPPSPGAPTADPFVQAAPNGQLYRLTVTNTGGTKWVKIEAS